MNKKIIFLVGSLLIVLLALIWVYLMVFGTASTSDEVFSKIGLNGEETSTQVVEEEIVTTVVGTSTLNTNRAKLRQLSTKLIAGYGEVIHSTSSAPEIYIAELGTGHIYTINLNDGTENRISATTFAQADQAVFSPDGNYLALTNNAQTKNKPLHLGIIDTENKETRSIFTTNTTANFSLSNKEFLFTNTNDSGVVGYSYSLVDNSKVSVFEIPFFEAKVTWGESGDSPHYIYPKSSFALEGFLYEATKKSISRLPISGFGLTAKVNSDMIIYTKIEKNKPSSFIYDRITKETKPFISAILTDKCFLPVSGKIFYCGFEIIKETRLPDVWYQGTVSFKDNLFALSANTMLAELLVNIFNETNRELDVIDLRLSKTGLSLYFINKNDNTLWLYEI